MARAYVSDEVAIVFSSADDLIAALKGRMPWAKKLDARRLKEHRKAETKTLSEFRARCREAASWGYEKAKGRYFNVDDNRLSPPSCPRSLVDQLEHIIDQLEKTSQKRFDIKPDGHWATVHYLLTHDEDRKEDVC